MQALIPLVCSRNQQPGRGEIVDEYELRCGEFISNDIFRLLDAGLSKSLSSE
jgi:hypothetical protein